MSEPFKMKGSEHYGQGNQHSEGKGVGKMYDAPTDFNAKLRAADLPEGKFKDAVDASGPPYASPAKQEGTSTKDKLDAFKDTIGDINDSSTISQLYKSYNAKKKAKRTEAAEAADKTK